MSLSQLHSGRCHHQSVVCLGSKADTKDGKHTRSINWTTGLLLDYRFLMLQSGRKLLASIKYWRGARRVPAMTLQCKEF